MAVKTSEAFNPFAHLKLSSWEPLRSVTRDICSKCKSSRKIYCYDCYQFLPNVDRHSIPRVSLPIPIDIIKHSQEVQGKSTAIHAIMLAPDHVALHNYPSLPNIIDPYKCVLVFPKEGALTVSEWVSQNRTETTGGMDWGRIERVIFIDSTWLQTRKIIKDVDHLPCVVLTEAETHFWRPQRSKTTSHLATIEAIYYFFKETCQPQSYQGEYDDLLYFYAYQYDIVHQAMTERTRLWTLNHSS